MGAGLICSGYIFILGSLHLELLHSLLGLGNIDLIIALHIGFSPFRHIRKAAAFRMGERLFFP